MVPVPTERIARFAVAAVPTEPDVIEKGVLIAKSTLAGLCLTAFACGIITTVAIGHGRGVAADREARVQEVQAVAPPAPPAPAVATSPAPAVVASPAPAEVPVAAPAPVAADPLVVQLAAASAAAAAERAERTAEKEAPQHMVAARTARPPVTRTPPVRRRPTPSAATATAEAPASSAPAPAPVKWVDPFAE